MIIDLSFFFLTLRKCHAFLEGSCTGELGIGDVSSRDSRPITDVLKDVAYAWPAKVGASGSWLDVALPNYPLKLHAPAERSTGKY